MKERRADQDRRTRIEDRRQEDRRRDNRRQGRRRKEYCPRCGTLLSSAGLCSVCKVRVIRIR